MLLGGLWHGASWNFVLWGFLHGLALAAHRSWKTFSGQREMPDPVARLLTFSFVMLCWLPFRSPSLETTGLLIRKLLGLEGGGGRWYPEVLAWSLAVVAAGHFFGTMLGRHHRAEGWFGSALETLSIRRMENPISGVWPVFEGRSIAGSFVAAAVLLSIYFFGAANASPFIYFQF
jgi:alginate O-acetyltransferase complex protein AlgI